MLGSVHKSIFNIFILIYTINDTPTRVLLHEAEVAILKEA